MKIYLPLVLALVPATACSPNSSSDDGSRGGVGGKADDPSALIPITMDCDDASGDAVELSDAAITGDVLTVTASYGGGCKPHTFNVCWDGAFAESYPVQAHLVLRHDGNDDHCEAYASQELHIDLREIAEAYRASYEPSGNVLVFIDQLWASYAVEERAGLAARFAEAAEGATYASETDSEPTFISAPKNGRNINKTTIAEIFAEQLANPDNFYGETGYAMEIKGRTAARAWLADEADATENEDETAEAWGRIAALFDEELTGMKLILIGPKDEETGGMAEDAGTYYYLILGNTADGQIAGFYVEVAWT